MNEIDKWCAEQCGVEVDRNVWGIHPNYYSGEWTIKDPRCREIVRERFKLSTLHRDAQEGKWGCGDEASKQVGHGKTIAEAEIACITAIYEARDDI